MLIFAHMEKTGGRTVRSLLRNHFGLSQCELYNNPATLHPDDWKWIRLIYPNLRCLSGHACMPYTFLGDLPGARHFTFLRDPLRRAASAYQYGLHRKRDMPPFEQWVRRTGDFQTRMLAGGPDVDRAMELLDKRMGFVGLTERFNESIVLWKHWLQIPGFDRRYVSCNVSRDNHIKREILNSDRARRLIAEANPLDDQLLRHVRERIYPLQQQWLGPTLDAEVEAFESSLREPAPPSCTAALGRCKRNLIFRPLWKRMPLRKRDELTHRIPP